jgi:hypothetical protein
MHRRPVDIDAEDLPVLNADKAIPNQAATLYQIGWGATAPGSQQSSVLKAVANTYTTRTVVGSDICAQPWQICTMSSAAGTGGAVAANADTGMVCQGDSGGVWMAPRCTPRRACSQKLPPGPGNWMVRRRSVLHGRV